MYKKFLYLIILIVVSLNLSACSKNKTLILFNKYPVIKETLLNNATEFNAGKRIYYIFLTDKPLETKMIRIKIYKRDEKANYGVTKVAFTGDFKVMKDQLYYYNDYIVLHDAGYYYMAIFAMNGLDKPLATADFRVKN